MIKILKISILYRLTTKYNHKQHRGKYKLILKELRKIPEKDNLYFKPIKPKISDIKVISLIILAEFKSIDSEHHLFREIKVLEIESKLNAVYIIEESVNY